MLVIRGEPALSKSRIEKILARLGQVCAEVSTIQTEYIYLVNTDVNPAGEDLSRLASLLHANTGSIGNYQFTDQVVVIPRPGTISPWSSKATDIVHHCGLDYVKRVERGIAWRIDFKDGKAPGRATQTIIEQQIYDRMTQIVAHDITMLEKLFATTEPRPLRQIKILGGDKSTLEDANIEMGLALSEDEIEYLYDAFTQLKRYPTDVELMMFAQANSEHCRHKIFNGEWTIDGARMPETLFNMIRSTHREHPGRVLSAYKDNAAVMRGYHASRFIPDPLSRRYTRYAEDVHILMKVETHNHPTAISPFPGAATGAGGEIRDEAATGTGAKPKAGMCGFAVSNLRIPENNRPWETDLGKPERIVSALEIMLEGPIGAASYNNEFGRPALCGYFRSYEQQLGDTIYGYHKPIMLAGGYGVIRQHHVTKKQIPAGAKIIVLGGPAMLIGLGGGAASSMASGESDAELDFASVQRDNPEMQRRCQEVIDRCWAMGDANPIISIHDVGAGGLSNALPELIHESGLGARFELREINSDDPGMSPMEIWCNESQERYVLAINAENLNNFRNICERERAPFTVVGEADTTGQLVLTDSLAENRPIDLPLNVLLGKPPRSHRTDRRIQQSFTEFESDNISLEEAISRILQLPTVADKRFLITIGDRSVSGLVTRDQMVGPWQTPVADCAITASSYDAYTGEAMAIGERPPVAIVNSPASGRLAIAEAITNIAAARILELTDISLSANWMAACGQPGEDAKLYDTVEAVSCFARQLRIGIPVGKDSLSMNTVWNEDDRQRQVMAPLSVNITAFAPVADIRKSLTPQLMADTASTLVLIDLGLNRNRLGGSSLAQVFNQIGGETPDIEQPELLRAFFQTIQLLSEMDLIMAYHDRSDGGLFVTLAEMAFAGHCGIDVGLECDGNGILSMLFSEEAGAVIQVADKHLNNVLKAFHDSGLPADSIIVIGKPVPSHTISISNHGKNIYQADLTELHQLWSSTTFCMQSIRDNPECARQEMESMLDMEDPGLTINPSFNMNECRAPAINTGIRPAIAILREQGVNGQVEMAAAFDRAGFDCIDIHMTDLLNGEVKLSAFHGLVTCGGFSYGDVLGAGGGWAKSILYNPRLKEMFSTFFYRKDTFGLGVCNGCQMFSQLRDLIPGAGSWPYFIRNLSEQFEARLVMVEITESPSILTYGMTGSKIPVVVAHGEGRADFGAGNGKPQSFLRYIDNRGNPTEKYPANPAGTSEGLTGFTTDDGRYSIMMPHPERVFLKKQLSYAPADWHYEATPWMQLFLNARKWLQ